MEIRARQKNNIIILDFFGRIDVDAANLIEVVGQCIRDGYKEGAKKTSMLASGMNWQRC